MSGDDELRPESLARSSLRFRRRIVELSPEQVIAIEPAQWNDAIVFLTAGEIEVECEHGERRRFSCGAVLCFAPPLRVIRNCGDGHAQLVAVSRRTRRTG